MAFYLLRLSRYIKIGQASQLLGVTPQTLRRWEREGQLSPDRVSEGQTRYFLNAAINLFRTVSSTGPQACGEGGSGSSTRWRETVLCEAGTWA